MKTEPMSNFDHFARLALVLASCAVVIYGFVWVLS